LEEHIASIFRVMKAVCSFETLILTYQTIQYDNPEHENMDLHHPRNFTPSTFLFLGRLTEVLVMMLSVFLEAEIRL
jgi:hypothetical protein